MSSLKTGLLCITQVVLGELRPSIQILKRRGLTKNTGLVQLIRLI